jgi:hypothetical protein
MPFYDRNSTEIDISTMIAFMGSEDYVCLERDVIKSDKGPVLILTKWTGLARGLFETYVSGGPIDGHYECSDKELDALVLHKKTVELVKEVMSNDYSNNE